MAIIAYVDHSFHRMTKSTDFLPQILRRHGHIVDYFWDEAWRGGAPIEWTSVESYDVVIMFQSFCVPPAGLDFRRAHPNVIYIPMLDQFGQWQGPLNLTSFWEPFQGSKVINFSNALHSMTTGFGIVSHFARYYPPVGDYSTPPQQGLHGFFWIRRERELPWQVIRKLIAYRRFDSFHIHLATDPGTPQARLPSAEDVKRHNITTSTWFDNKDELNAHIARANIFFAPRPEEGIGQAFLAAMARGHCVVAPNHGTMNEYILPGINGLLYDIRNPTALDFSDVADLGRRAKKSTLFGRRRWEDAEQGLVQFILAPSASLYINCYQRSGSSVEEPQLTGFSTTRSLFTVNSLIGSLRRAFGGYAILRAVRRKIGNLIK